MNSPGFSPFHLSFACGYPFHSVAWSPDGTRLASSGEDSNLYVWDASDGTRLTSGDGSRGSTEMLLWDVHTGERLHTFAEPPGSVFALEWSPRGELLVSGGSDGMLRWWDVQSGEHVRMRFAHQGAVQSIRISSDGHRLTSCGDDSTIQVWDLASAELLRHDRPTNGSTSRE